MFHRLGLQMVRWRYWIVGIWALAVLIGLPFAPRVAEVLAPGGFSSNSMESQQTINALQKGLSALNRYFRRYGLELDESDVMERVRAQIDKFRVG